MKSDGIQNLLLVILIIANLILVGAGVVETLSGAANEEKYEKYVIELLEEKGIRLAKGVEIYSTPNGSVLDTPEPVDAQDFAAGLFGCEKEELSVFAIPGGGSSIVYGTQSFSLSSDGRISYRDENFSGGEADYATVSSDTVQSRNAAKTASDFIKRMSGVGEAEFTLFEESSDGRIRLSCRQWLSGISVSDTELCLYVENGKVLFAEGVWRLADGAKTYSCQLYGVADVLFPLTDTVNECTINTIELVYGYLPYADDRYMLVPSYVISVEADGEIEEFTAYAVG